MSNHSVISDWATSRGEKWRDNISGMEKMLNCIDAPLIEALRLDAPYRIADIACGGAGTTLEIYRQAPSASIVSGFDISPALIDSARARAQRFDCDIQFDVIDLGTAAAPQQPFQRLVSRFGIMFFDNPAVAFANLFNWLTPGGRFAFAVWGRASENPWMTNINQAVSAVVDIPLAPPEGPGAFRYGDKTTLNGLLEKAGFAEIEITDWHGKLPMGGEYAAAEAANFAITSFSAFAEWLIEAGGTAFSDAKKDLTARFAKHEQNGVVMMDACVLIYTGKRA
jgi:SAM-dependent methyltransferase